MSRVIHLVFSVISLSFFLYLRCESSLSVFSRRESFQIAIVILHSLSHTCVTYDVLERVKKSVRVRATESMRGCVCGSVQGASASVCASIIGNPVASQEKIRRNGRHQTGKEAQEDDDSIIRTCYT